MHPWPRMGTTLSLRSRGRASNAETSSLSKGWCSLARRGGIPCLNLLACLETILAYMRIKGRAFSPSHDEYRFRSWIPALSISPQYRTSRPARHVLESQSHRWEGESNPVPPRYKTAEMPVPHKRPTPVYMNASHRVRYGSKFSMTSTEPPSRSMKSGENTGLKVGFGPLWRNAASSNIFSSPQIS